MPNTSGAGPRYARSVPRIVLEDVTTPLTIPVVFHVMFVEKGSGLTVGKVPLAKIQQQMHWLNDAFSGRVDDPLAIDSRIRFSLAAVEYHRSGLSGLRMCLHASQCHVATPACGSLLKVGQPCHQASLASLCSLARGYFLGRQSVVPQLLGHRSQLQAGAGS